VAPRAEEVVAAAAEAAPTAEGAAEPEVIKKGKQETEAEGEAGEEKKAEKAEKPEKKEKK